jgi:hypothetical protein
MQSKRAIHHDSLTVPQSVTSSTRGGLRLAMLKINQEQDGRVIFQDIQQIEENGKKLWCAWFYERITLESLEDENAVLE